MRGYCSFGYVPLECISLARYSNPCQRSYFQHLSGFKKKGKGYVPDICYVVAFLTLGKELL